MLLWIGCDLGAHGIFASDFEPISTGADSRMSVDNSVGTTTDAPDHCFCHGVSVAAVVPAEAAGLTPAGTLTLDLNPQMPAGDPHRLYRPPQ